VANKSKLKEEEINVYQSCYCGLCKALKKRGRLISSLTLNYDMTFLIIVLNSLFDKPCESGECKCFLKWKKMPCRSGEITEYTADMNILLSYYKMVDDWKDDRNIFAYLCAKRLEKQKNIIEEKYPEKSEAVKKYLEDLSEYERRNALDPDGEALIFGKLMGEIFTPYDEKREELNRFGIALGKFIYILDAITDLKKDIKKKKYNPLISTEKSEHKDMLNILMADCLEAYEKLEIERNKGIIENILLSGVWTGYLMHEMRMKKHQKNKEDN